MGKLEGSGPLGSRVGASTSRRIGAGLRAQWPLASVGLVALLGWQVSGGPSRLEALRPWGPEFGGLPLERCSSEAQLATCEAIEPAEQALFVDEVQLALLGLAERLNTLRQVGSEALRRGAAAELLPAGERALDGLERELCRLAIGRPLFRSGRGFVLRDPQGTAWRLDLGGFDACLVRLAGLDYASRPAVEALLGDLDRAYYRLVAAYRALSELEPEADPGSARGVSAAP